MLSMSDCLLLIYLPDSLVYVVYETLLADADPFQHHQLPDELRAETARAYCTAYIDRLHQQL